MEVTLLPLGLSREEDGRGKNEDVAEVATMTRRWSVQKTLPPRHTPKLKEANISVSDVIIQMLHLLSNWHDE